MSTYRQRDIVRKHPWETFSGMWKDDSTFDDFLSEIEAERQKRNNAEISKISPSSPGN